MFISIVVVYFNFKLYLKGGVVSYNSVRYMNKLFLDVRIINPGGVQMAESYYLTRSDIHVRAIFNRGGK